MILVSLNVEIIYYIMIQNCNWMLQFLHTAMKYNMFVSFPAKEITEKTGD